MSKASLITLLESTFENILLHKMQDIPILNNKLKVQAVGFTCWQGYDFGALITPWFMNLILLPQDSKIIEFTTIGEIKNIKFPSGYYDFIVNVENNIGKYLSCSLFSPMFEFEDQAAAELTAINALIEILSETGSSITENNTLETSQIVTPIKKTSPTEKIHILNRNKSRRDFLRGKIFITDEVKK